MASINYAVADNWGAGFVGNMAVSAGSQALKGWTIEFDAAFDITNIWGAEIVSRVGNHYVIRNASWNADVPAGGTASFGFQAKPGSSGGTTATGLTINGAGTDPAPVLPTLSIADASITEGNSGTTEVSFTVTLSKAATGPVTVNYATGNGTATAGSDYTAKTGTLTFAAGETSKVIKVIVTGDTAVEANETLSVTLSGASGATLARAAATGTIVNDDTAPPPVPTLSIADASVSEGDSGTTELSFTVTLSQVAAGAVTVNYATGNGTATAGSDYTAKTGSLTFAAGETSKVIKVVVTGDTAVEANETLSVTLSGASGATLAPAAATGTIVNDDTAPPPAGAVSLNYTVGSNWGSGFNADMKVGGGSAPLNGWTIEFDATFNITNIWNAEIVSHVGNHYVIRNASYNGQVAAGQQTGFGFQATPGSGGTQASGFTVNGTAVGQNPPPLPTLSVADASVSEGNSGGTAELSFTVTLSQAATGPVTVNYATSNGTATAGSDYTAKTGMLTFAAGETSKVIKVAVTGEAAVEANETLSLVLSAPSGATVARATATGTIVNDDTAPAPTISISDASFSEGSAATPGKGTFTVTLSAASSSPVTVGFATANGTAIAGSDYVAQAGTLTFAAGETSKTITINAIGDSTVESNESFSVVLSNPAGATLAKATGAGTIVNDDAAPPPTISISDSSFNEGSAVAPGQATFTVTLSAAATGPVTVSYATANGTATAGNDYVAKSGTITFAAGETSKTISVSAIGDSVVEPNESFSVVLSNPSGATIADGTGVATIVNDDVAVVPTLSISDVSVIEGTPGVGGALSGWLSTSGNQIVDSAGNNVQIAGVNWFGFESSTLAPHGLWTRGYKDMMQQMSDLGFNTIRLPFSSEMLDSTAAPNGIDFSKNPDLQGLSALQIMDKIVDYAGTLGLKIILDHHRSDSGAGTSGNGLWYDGNHSQAEWVSDWQMLAQRYASKPQVIGADLHNEPHNGTWGGGGANDWALAAETAGNAIGAVNPNWLIFVEGVGTYQGQSYWWGGNLMGVKDRPIQLDVPNKLVYSAHDYPNSIYPQPWFQGSDFPANLPAKFDQMWGYIYKQGIAPVYIGEFGTKLTDPKDAPWFDAITSYISGDLNNDGTNDLAAGKKGVSWTFWSWNPNSGDTGGILQDNWNGVNQNKMAYLTPIQFDFPEGSSGPAHADFVLTLSAPATTTVTVAYQTVAGTAGSADFTGQSGTVTFAPGEQSKTISIAITPDALVEGNEQFTVVLSNAQGATISKATGTGTIINDDAAPPPTVSIGDASFNEGSAAIPGKGTFTVTLSAAATGPVTVNFATANGTATAGSDYVAKSGTLTFAAGETSKTITVDAIGDSTVESNESFSVVLSSPSGATLAKATGAGTIVNDDVPPPPTISISDSSFNEGSAAAPGQATFTVTLSAAATGPVTVAFATANGTATAGSDYVAASGTVTFAAGETSKTITVNAIGDAVIEPNEGFTVVLSNPSGATIADGTGAGTLVNDDPTAPVLPTLGIADASAIEGNPGGSGGVSGWLSTSGNQIVDASGNNVQIAGVNWFGFESSNLAPHGLWTRGYKDMMQQMSDLGFNTIRLPFSSEMLDSTAAPNGIDFSKNPDLQGLSALQIMDKIVDYAGTLGLRIILDHHRSDSGAGTSGNGLWYDGNHSQAEWVSDWQMLATRYANKPQVIGADLHNEPHNGTWGGGGPNDWALAAETAGNAIGAVNPNWLIFVEGVGTYQGQGYWWGGNLMGVRDRPIDLDVANKLVYSAHDYPNSIYPQPWFQGADFPANLPAKFDQMWGFIYKEGIAPVYIGEFGTKLTDPKDAPWFDAITSYISGDLNNDGTNDLAAGKKGVSWTFWSWNPNSGDTGGILKDDWNTVNTNKMAYLTPIQFDFPEGGAGTAAHADFVLTLSAPATTTITVAYQTVAGEATAADFTGQSGTVTFAPGEQSKTISIAITPDSIDEANEQFAVVLSNAQGATISKATGTGTIVDDDVAPTPPTPPTPPSANAWSSSATYNTGSTVTENGVTYRANWWNQGSDPAHNSGYANDGVMWSIVSGTPPAVGWLASGIYTTGLTVTQGGIVYKANWWTQGTDPATNNGNGKPWSVVGPADGSGNSGGVVPYAPTNLDDVSTSAYTALLSWDAATSSDHAPVTGYAIFSNDQQIATTTGTTYLVTGLTPDTTYQFTVKAIDPDGASAPSAVLSVHTPVFTAPPPGGELEREFSPYIDMAMSQAANLASISQASGIDNFTLAFVLSSSEGIGWQGVGGIDDDHLANGSTILQQVQAIQAMGGNITISFGGAAGQEAALNATSAQALQAAYQSVIDRYNVDSLDFDIEGGSIANQASLHLRDQAIVGLQAANPDLTVSFTLPVLPTGLDHWGLNLLQTAKQDGVRVDVVNIMAMDYGTAVDNNGQMGLNAILAAEATQVQLQNLGIDAKIGITPMIGVNDIVSEVFTQADAQALLAYAQNDSDVVRLSMWSVARDNGSGAGQTWASPDSSGIAQTTFEFASIFNHFDVTA